MRFLSAIAISFIATSSVEAFTIISNRGKPASWSGNSAHYQFHPQTSGYFDGGDDASGTASDDFNPIRSAFNNWVNIPGMDLTVTEDAYSLSGAPNAGDNVNSIYWVRTAWRSLSFRPPSNALAVTLISFDDSSSEIAEADIFFNAQNFAWAVVDSPEEEGDYIDVENIATHEIGHFLGLDHSSEDLFEVDTELADATMYYAASTGETARRSPNDDDSRGMLSLYGSSDRGNPTVRSAEIISDSSGLLTLRVHGTGFSEYTSFVITTGSASELDYVSRYKTISSSTEADVIFDIGSFLEGDTLTGTLLAMNQPSNAGSLRVSFSNLSGSTGVSVNSSSGGGGGCSLGYTVHDQPALGPWVLVLFALLLFSLRLSLRLVRLRACSTQRGKNKS